MRGSQIRAETAIKKIAENVDGHSCPTCHQLPMAHAVNGRVIIGCFNEHCSSRWATSGYTPRAWYLALSSWINHTKEAS